MHWGISSYTNLNGSFRPGKDFTMNIFEAIQERMELHAAKKSAMKLVKNESRRYDAQIDAARDRGDVVGVLMNGAFKNLIRQNGKAIARSANPLECDIRRTGTNAASAAGRIVDRKVKEWNKNG